MRESGILLPIASLSSRYGIGCFSKEAYEFVDALKAAGQKYWQILPLGPTGYGDSPYQSFSAFAGNPYFIDLEKLTEEGLLAVEECDEVDFGNDGRYIDYEKQYISRFILLRKAYNRWIERHKGLDEEVQSKLHEILGEETREYCFFMAVKNHFNSRSWETWDEDIKLRKQQALAKYREMLRDEILFYEFQQMKFEQQWSALKSYAHEQGVKIIGDIPIYVAFDSADSWAHPELFRFDENSRPAAVAGCPPDGFSATGQLWGNPLYRWDYHEATGFAWWMKRMSYCFRLYDVVRLDHFRGFDEYYSIPFGEDTAIYGQWERGPGISIFQKMEEVFGEVDIIAEDLGFLTPSVIKLVADTGFPGMKVLQFAFDSREKSNYLPCYYCRNCVVYTGTHDNDTVRGWYEKLDEADKQLSIAYMNNESTPVEEIHWDFIRLAQSSVAELSVIPLQDYLGLGSEARINTPSTLGGNWAWRMRCGEFADNIVEKCREITELYGRA